LVGAVVTNNPRDRKLVTLAGIIPDADGLGMVVDVGLGLISGKEVTFQYYQQFHHLLMHGWPAALAVVALLASFARNRARVFIFGLLTFHLHLVCDLIGSRGPSPSDLWPICYGEPLFFHPIWIWRGQWRLDGWQNQSIFLVVFLVALWLAARRGYSFLELAGRRVDTVFVGVLQKWRTRLRPKQPPS
jgi:hypothetical protein